ncbi:MAG: hypothetical protein JWM27_1479 [Gemmatimonadetes bacterium]|nr:hypothetical protein [Gemmatimonadota bacterium]
MPNVAVHFVLARRALLRWSERPSLAPFRAADPAAAEAFLYGAVAPDAGYWPGGDRLFSELAHLWRTGDLARVLGQSAGDGVGRAYAWGWASHVLADLEVHPLINQAHGERVHGSRGRPVSSTEDVENHMRLEYGLDVAAAARHPWVERVRLRHALPDGVLTSLDDALRATWGWAPPPAQLAASHRTAAVAVRLGAWSNRVQGAAWDRRPLSAALRAVGAAFAPPRRWMPRAWNASAAAVAVLAPLPPPAWLLDEMDAVAERFAATLDAHRDGDVPALPNHDLITGDAHRPDALPARTTDALRQLAARGGFRASTHSGQLEDSVDRTSSVRSGGPGAALASPASPASADPVGAS